jgi:hypothetical protein
MFTYRLYLEDGSDDGDATYAQIIKLGDEIHLGAGQRFRVLDMSCGSRRRMSRPTWRSYRSRPLRLGPCSEIRST